MIKKIIPVLLVGLFIFAPITSSVSAQVNAPFPAVEDAAVDANRPTSNFGEGSLYVDYTNFGIFGFGWSTYTKFNLSANLTGPVTNATIIRFTISSPVLFSMDLALWSTSDSWSESNMTANSAPGGITKLATAIIHNTSTTVEFSGSALANYINTELTNDGIASFLLRVDTPCPNCTTFTDMARIYSSENVNGLGPQIIPQQPTAVTVGPLGARGAANHVALDWETFYEGGIQGFQVLRGTGDNPDDAEPVNDEPLLANGGGVGHGYTLADGNAVPGVEYYYWLRILYNNGQEIVNGPVTAAADYGLYLPMIR